MLTKAQALEDLEKESPIDGIESLGNIKLEKKAQNVTMVEIFDEVLNVHEVVLNGSLLDKSTLTFGDQSRQHGSQTVGQKL